MNFERVVNLCRAAMGSASISMEEKALRRSWLLTGEIGCGAARKYFAGVEKVFKASQSPWEGKPEGFLLLGFCESLLQS